MANPASLNGAPSVSIVIPVYGTGECLEEIVARADQALLEAGLRCPQVVLVDDHGPGDSWSIIQRLCREREATVGLQLMRNFGQHNAIMAGFHQSVGSVVITMDDDLQHVPECIPDLLSPILAGNVDVVYGRYRTKKHAAGRNLGSAIISTFYRVIFGLKCSPSALRAIRKEVVENIVRYDLNFTYIDGLLAWNTTRIQSVDVVHRERQSGKSGYTLRGLLFLSINLFTNFSLIPLQLCSLFGAAASGMGIVLGCWYLITGLTGRIEVPGYASTIVSIFVLGGAQLMCLGVIGEYVGRIHMNINRKPQYAIRTITGATENRG